MARNYPRKSATRSTQNKSAGSSSAAAFLAGMLVIGVPGHVSVMAQWCWMAKYPDSSIKQSITKAAAEGAKATGCLTFSFDDVLKDVRGHVISKDDLAVDKDQAAPDRRLQLCLFPAGGLIPK